MSEEEEKKVAEAKALADAEAKVKADEEAAKIAKEAEDKSDEDEDEGDEGDSSLKIIDYKAELEVEKEARKKAEIALAEKRFKTKHKEEEEDDDDEDKPLTRKELTDLLESNRWATIKEANSERIMDIANDMADSPEEAELIVEIHRNRSFPSYLSIREQIEEAHAIANRKKIVSKNSELTRALKAKGNVSKDNAGTFRDGQQGAQPKLAADLVISLKRAGFDYDVKNKVYKKKLPNGKFLVRDAKGKSLGVIA